MVGIIDTLYFESRDRIVPWFCKNQIQARDFARGRKTKWKLVSLLFIFLLEFALGKNTMTNQVIDHSMDNSNRCREDSMISAFRPESGLLTERKYIAHLDFSMWLTFSLFCDTWLSYTKCRNHGICNLWIRICKSELLTVNMNCKHAISVDIFFKPFKISLMITLNRKRLMDTKR